MRAWIRKRAKRRKDGRLVFVTTVVFDAAVFDTLYGKVEQDRLRSAVINEAVRYVLDVPGWVNGVVERLTAANEVPSKSTRISNAPPTRKSPGKGAPNSRRGTLSSHPEKGAVSSKKGAPSSKTSGASKA